jgi:hypothetical protein
MKTFPSPLDLKKVKVFPLGQRKSLSRLESILVNPQSAPPDCTPVIRAQIQSAATRIKTARDKGASVMLCYGAHLVKNGLAGVVNELVTRGWVTHLATNGAGTIHDWELSFLGCTEESVRENVATGTFGTWDETGRNIHLALMAGAVRGQGYGQSLGQFIADDGIDLPSLISLETQIRDLPAHVLTPARAELLRAMVAHKIPAGRMAVKHPHKEASILATAFRNLVPLTVHPGIGYDIIATHPMFRGAVIGRAADIDFRLFGGAVDRLDDGVVLSIGSAVMAPQVFEKSLSCVNNLRLQSARKIVTGHSIFVVDIQDGGNWDWSAGEPPKSSPAYYLRFCKSFARMGGAMRYVQSDNAIFLHNLLHALG